MPIDIIVGLPHLNEGAILARARSLQQTALISANGLSRWSTKRGWREWAGWRTDQLQKARGLSALCLDSAGFVAAARYGGFPWTIADYVVLASAYPFRWWASADYCVESEVARDRKEVIDRLSRTIRANRDCRKLAKDYGIADTLMPVIQGRRPDDYERCIDALWYSIRPGSPVGVGSMCRREIHGPEGLIAVVDHLDRILPSGVRLHLFGVKGTALPFLLPYGRRVASIDSQAYGISARRTAFRRGVPKTDMLVADHMEGWIDAQRAPRRSTAAASPIPASAHRLHAARPLGTGDRPGTRRDTRPYRGRRARPRRTDRSVDRAMGGRHLPGQPRRLSEGRGIGGGEHQARRKEGPRP